MQVLQFRRQVYLQKSGILIGGPVIGAVLDSALSMCESWFDRCACPELARRLGMGKTKGDWPTVMMYVDDVLIHSFRLFPKCVGYMVFRFYGVVVGFDCSNDGECKVDNYNLF